MALGQMEVIPGRPDANSRTMLSMIERARRQQAQMIIFPEMAIPGYLLGDTWEQPGFLKDCEEYGRVIIAASKDIAILFGNIAIDWKKTNNDGRVRKYNGFFTAHQGCLHGADNFPYPFRIKTLQPNYREFDDTRHFFSLRELAIERGESVESLLQPVRLQVAGHSLALGCILCEDGWSDDYSSKPIHAIQANGPVNFFINISCSPFTLGKNNKRNRIFSRQARESEVPLIYVNNVGLQNNGKTIYTFDGYSTIYNGKGEIIDYCPSFQPALKYIDLDLKKENRKQQPLLDIPDDRDIGSIYRAIRYGIEKFLQTINMNKVVIGVSGGIDSAVSAALYVNVLGPQNVLLVNMPSVFNSQTTKDLAAKLAHNLGCLYTVMPIQDVVNYTVKQISEATVNNLSSGKNEFLQVSSFITENIQARDRSARVLAGIAAAFGGGFTCNANKSELTVGYSTLYGDQAGFLAALADLWKYQVYDIARYINAQVYKRSVIPQETIDIIPSAELSLAQAVDEGKGDPLVYPYHDYLFRSFIEYWNKATPEDILYWYQQGVLEEKIGCEPGIVRKLFPTLDSFIADLEKWWKQYSGIGIAKRIQAPPVLAISRRAYGFDHRESQNGVYFTARYYQLKQQLLSHSNAPTEINTVKRQPSN
ncbi:MAG: NAD(+) synthase [Veillonellales bacterium]